MKKFNELISSEKMLKQDKKMVKLALMSESNIINKFYYLSIFSLVEQEYYIYEAFYRT